MAHENHYDRAKSTKMIKLIINNLKIRKIKIRIQLKTYQ